MIQKEKEENNQTCNNKNIWNDSVKKIKKQLFNNLYVKC